MRNMSRIKSPMTIGKYVEWIVGVSLIVCWMSRIMCMSSSCVGIYKWISTMGVRGVLTIVISCR